MKLLPLAAITMPLFMTACEPAPQSGDEGREAQRQRLGAERIDHAAHCLAITKAVSSLATPVLRQQAAELGLDDVKPQFAVRWHSVLKQQVQLARADTAEISAAIDRNAVVIRDTADLNAVADDAFDCVGEIERSGND